MALKIRRNGQESLICSGKVCIWRESVIFMRVPRVRSRKFRWRWLGNLPAMWILLFCCRNCKNNTKINRKKGGRVEGARPLGHPLNPRMVPMGFYNPVIPMVIRQHPASHAYFQSRILTQFFLRSLLPGVPRLNASPFGF